MVWRFAFALFLTPLARRDLVATINGSKITGWENELSLAAMKLHVNALKDHFCSTEKAINLLKLQYCLPPYNSTIKPCSAKRKHTESDIARKQLI